MFRECLVILKNNSAGKIILIKAISGKEILENSEGEIYTIMKISIFGSALLNFEFRETIHRYYFRSKSVLDSCRNSEAYEGFFVSKNEKVNALVKPLF